MLIFLIAISRRWFFFIFSDTRIFIDLTVTFFRTYSVLPFISAFATAFVIQSAAAGGWLGLVGTGAGIFERTSTLHTARTGTPGIAGFTLTFLVFAPAACPRATSIPCSRTRVFEIGFAHATLRLSIELVVRRAGALRVICPVVIGTNRPAARRTPTADISPGVARVGVAFGFVFCTGAALTSFSYHMPGRYHPVAIRISRTQGATFLIFTVTTGTFAGLIRPGTGLVIFRFAHTTGMIGRIIKAGSARCRGFPAVLVDVALLFALFLIIDFPVVLASIPAG